MKRTQSHPLPETGPRRALAFFATLAVVAPCAACSSSSTPAPTDSGTPDTSHPHDSGKTPHDAAKDTAPPFSACGHPGDKGNSMGIGQYCTDTSQCPSTAPICSNIENNPMDPKKDTFFCVLPCNDCSPADFCGSGASCVCVAPGMCGCTPDSCTSIIPDGGKAVCPDAGDAGAG